MYDCTRNTTGNSQRQPPTAAKVIHCNGLARNEVPQELWLYWTFRDDVAVVDGIILKGR